MEKCFFCDKQAVQARDIDMFLGCEEHLEKAHAYTRRESEKINNIGFQAWVDSPTPEDILEFQKQ